MTTYTAEQIESIGGRRWSKSDGTLRVYINADVWAPMVGLEIRNYKSGNISYAELNGATISNRKAGTLLAIKAYWESGKIWITRNAELADEIHAAIARAVADMSKSEDNTPTASERVTTLRRAGRTARDIAQMVGVSASTVYRWARGICQPTPAHAAALAALA